MTAIIIPQHEETPPFLHGDPKDVQEWTTKGSAFWYPEYAGQKGYDAATALAINDAREALSPGTKFILMAKRRLLNPPFVRNPASEYAVAWYTDPWIQAGVNEKKVASSIDAYEDLKYTAPSRYKGRTLRVLGCLKA